MKKKIVDFILVMIPALIIFAAACESVPAPESIKKQVKSLEEEYTTVAKLCYDHYRMSGDTDAKELYAYGLSRDKDGRYSLYCWQHDEILSMSNLEYFSLYEVAEDFYLDHHSLDHIYAYKGFVTFGIPNASTTLIYSVDGKRPFRLDEYYQRSRVCSITRINDHWYYACLLLWG